MRVVRTLLVALMLLAPPLAGAFDIPEFTPNVVDTGSVLDAAAKQSINDELQRIRGTSHIWGAVLIVPTLDGEPIENVAVQTFEKWQLGKQGVDNGLLLVLAMNDRESRFEVGYGLEGAIPDVVALHALDAHLAPKMRAGDTAGAIVDAFAFLSRVVEKDPDAVRELSEADLETPPDWYRGLIGWIVFMFAVWLYPPIRNRWVAFRRARLQKLEPALLVDNEEITAPGESTKGLAASLFLKCFFSINPGIFVFMLSAAFVEAFYASIGLVLLFVLLMIYMPARRYASADRYRQFLEKLARDRAELIRIGHLKERSPGTYEYTPAYHASRASSSSSSSSSRSSSSSGGGRSGGGGASSRW